jgi:hypothetical protein
MTDKTRVAHIRSRGVKNGVRIDRKTEWGNPFRIGRDGTRDEVIARYAAWIAERPDMIKKARRDLKGKTLLCWCSPRACHGDVLSRIADSEEP